MTGAIVTAIIHHLAAFTLVSALIYEFMVFKSKELSVEQIRKLGLVDRFYGISALVLLFAGLARLADEKGAAYYMKNAAFHGKLTAFIIAALVSLYPTFKIISWNKKLRAGEQPQVEASTLKKIMMTIRIQKLAILVIIVCAVLMAKGVGSF